MRFFLLFLSLILGAILYTFPAAAQVEPASSELTLKSQLQPVLNAQQRIGLDWQWANQLQLTFSAADLQTWFDQAVPASTAQPVRLVSLEYAPHRGVYQLGLTIQPGLIWDQVVLELSLPQPDRLALRFRNNWIPSTWLNAFVAHRLQSSLDKLFVGPAPVDLRFHEDGLQLQWRKQEAQLALSKAQISLLPAALKMAFDPQGAVSIQYHSSALEPDKALLSLAADLKGHRLNQIQGHFGLQAQLDLEQLDLANIPAGTRTLADRVQGGEIKLTLQGQAEPSLTSTLPELAGVLNLEMNQTLIEGERVPQIVSFPIRWHWHDQDFQIYPQYPGPLKAAKPEFSENQLALFIDGPDYFKEMLRVIAQARESVDQEIFGFYDGESTTRLARLYLYKALGLTQTTDGQWQADLYAPEGIRVFLLHNHGLDRKGSQKVQAIFDRETDRLFAELASAGALPESILTYRKRRAQNLQIAALTRGAFKTDHRKLLVIDGTFAYTGGLNLGDHYMLADAFHDLMVRVQGPLVSAMHQSFIDNFKGLRPEQNWPWNMKTLRSLALSAGTPGSQVAVLLTDDQQMEIEPNILQAIAEARSQIRLEHAYLFYEPVQQALLTAVERGVRIDMIVSEQNDESIFELLNLDAIRQLMRAQKSDGQVRAHLFQSRGGEHDFMSHTKYLTVDGQVAIVGSANLIPRSLRSPFLAAGREILFNEEMSLLIHDPGFVAILDQRLFATDWQSRSRSVDLPEIERLIQARGGFWQLLLAKLQGILT